MTGTIAMPGWTRQLRYNATSNRFWAIYQDKKGGTGVVSIDGTTDAVSAPIDPTNGALNGPALLPASGKVYVGNGLHVDVIDEKAAAVMASVTLPELVAGVTADATANKVFALLNPIGKPYEVAVIDPTTNLVVGAPLVLSDITYVPTPQAGIDVDATKGTLYVYGIGPTQALNVVEIDEATMTVTKTTPVPSTGFPAGFAATPGNLAVATRNANTGKSTAELVDPLNFDVPMGFDVTGVTVESLLSQPPRYMVTIHGKAPDGAPAFIAFIVENGLVGNSRYCEYIDPTYKFVRNQSFEPLMDGGKVLVQFGDDPNASAADPPPELSKITLTYPKQFL